MGNGEWGMGNSSSWITNSFSKMTVNESTRLLKANSARGLGSKVAFNYDDLRRRCDEHIQQVRRQTRQMIEDAITEADSIHHQALDEAKQSGRREGLRQAEEEIQKRAQELAERMTAEQLRTTLPAMHSAAEALSLERDRWLAEWESAAIRLSVTIAEKLIRHELSIKPEISSETLFKTLELAAGQPQIKLRMHPDDLKLLGNHPEEVIRSMAACGDAAFVADETISRGGCVIETDHGIIDARLETQLERITVELLP